MKYKVLRYAAYVIEIFVFYVVQQVPELKIGTLEIKPLLLIPIALTIMMFENECVGMTFGLVCGILIDFGLTGTIGMFSFALPTVCYFCGALTMEIIQTNFLICMTISLIVNIMFFSANFFLMCFYNDFVWDAFLIKHLLRMACTWAMTPFFYLFNKAFALHIVEKE